MNAENLTIGFVGGTGAQGRGLAYRFARAGHRVVIGSRDLERAKATAAEIDGRLPLGLASGATNIEAAAAADVVVIAVPYAAHAAAAREVAESLAGKVVVDCVNPLAFDALGPYSLSIEDGSAAEELARIVPAARVVGAFHLVSAVNLWGDDDQLSHEDILVCGDDPDAKTTVIQLAQAVSGRPGIDIGALRMARYTEPLTAMIISVNKRYKVRAGIQLAGV